MSFKQTQYRCQKCKQIFTIERPEVLHCPNCQQVYDFAFLKQRQAKRWDKPSIPQHKKISIKIPEVIPPLSSLNSDIEKLKKKGRQPELVIKRVRLIIVLKDVYKLSFIRIGQLLERHHSTIVHLYHTYRA